MDEQLFYYLAGVPVLGLLAQWLAWRLRLPSILLLLLGGIILGQFIRIDAVLAGEHAVGSNAQAAQLLFPVVALSVAVILFEGGLSLRFSELRTAGVTVFRLVTLGAAISWLLTSLAAWLILGLDYRLSILLGAILVVTGPTVVAPMIRHIRPTKKIASIVKWEGIVIDPIGAILAVLVFEELFQAAILQRPVLTAIWIVLATATVGVAIGGAIGWFLTVVVKRFWIPDHLHGMLFLGSALGAFAVSNWLVEESGLVTVTVLGIYLANQKAVSLEHIVQFKENLGVFLISCLFIVLGSRLDLASLADGIGWRLLFLVVLIAIIRPASVLLSTLGTEASRRERLFISALAPRGIVAAAVASVFSLKISAGESDEPQLLQLAGEAEQLVPLVFLVIVGTVGFYGLTAAPLARRLGLADAEPQGLLIAGADDWIRQLSLLLQKSGVTVALVDTNYRNIGAAKMSGLRADCASILAEQIQEEADLSGIGRLLAMTTNDEVNVLATREYEHLFGKANVYQLPLSREATGMRGAIKETMRARELFEKGLNHRRIGELLAEGYQFKATPLTEEFSLDQYREQYGNEAKILFLLGATGRLQISVVGDRLKSQGKQTVIALVPPGQSTPTPEAAARNAAEVPPGPGARVEVGGAPSK